VDEAAAARVVRTKIEKRLIRPVLDRKHQTIKIMPRRIKLTI